MGEQAKWRWIVLAASVALIVAPAALVARQAGQSAGQKPPAEKSADAQQNPGAQEEDSVAEAARKAKADKSKASSKKVLTDEDLPKGKGDGISVVGDEGAATETQKAAGEKTAGTGAAKPGVKDEAYWRGRAKQIRDQMAQVDQEIEKTQDEIKKGGTAAFDAQSGLNQNVIYFEDRGSRLKKLEERKAQLQKQMDDLEDEARAAGVPSGWLR